MTSRNLALGLLAAGTLVSAAAPAAVITFDDLTLAPNTQFRNSTTTTFSSGGATFDYDAPFGDCCWSGFTYSNKTDVTTAGFANDGSAITGDGVGAGQDNYAVGFTTLAHLEFDTEQTLVGGYFTNTTYAYLAMSAGDDGNSPPFVKGPFGEGDFFTLTITSFDANNALINYVDVALATGSDILDEWLYVDLGNLGTAKSLRFGFSSSDVGAFGVNTPTYFAMDNLTTVPVPAAAWLFATAMGAAGIFRRKRAASRAA